MYSPEPEVGRGTNVWATYLPFIAIVEIQNSEALEVYVTSTIVSHQYDFQYLEDLRSVASTGEKMAHWASKTSEFNSQNLQGRKR